MEFEEYLQELEHEQTDRIYKHFSTSFESVKKDIPTVLIFTRLMKSFFYPKEIL